MFDNSIVQILGLRAPRPSYIGQTCFEALTKHKIFKLEKQTRKFAATNLVRHDNLGIVISLVVGISAVAVGIGPITVLGDVFEAPEPDFIPSLI